MSEDRVWPLTDFLLARIAEDEDRAGRIFETPTERRFATRMLAECEAKRRIVRGWADLYASPPPGDEYARQAGETAGHVFRCLALPYVDHPDYREEWRP